MQNYIPDPSEQVSFIIQHKVKPDQHEAYEQWLRKTIKEAATYSGHMGTHVTRPANGSDLYEIVVRFASQADAEQWIKSDRRRELIREVTPHIQEPETLDIKSGIDYWFTGATQGKSPPRWKQWLLTVSAIWPLSMILPFLLEVLFRHLPVLGVFGVRHLISAMVMVGLLTYVVMPPYTKALSKWLSR